jgi:hypothetical protein
MPSEATSLNYRMAKYKQGECSEPKQLKNVEPIMGMFHLEMAILQQLFRYHFGQEWDPWSLRMWLEELGQDYRKLWDDTQKGHVKNFSASLDSFYLVLRGYVLAAVAVCINKEDVNISSYSKRLASLSAEQLMAAIDTVANCCADFGYVQRLRSMPDSERDRDHENMILLLQHGLVRQPSRNLYKTS